VDDLELALDDIVIFELPTFEDVEAFAERFRPRWDGWSLTEEPLCAFTVRLDAQSDVAALLRQAQELVAELGLPAIRFSLDGRAYRLEAARPVAA
jgi:hypothetical protein